MNAPVTERRSEASGVKVKFERISSPVESEPSKTEPIVNVEPKFSMSSM